MQPPSSTSSEDAVPLDVVFAVLSHSTRRTVLTMIEEHNPRKREEFEPDALVEDEEDRELRHVALYHNHLPKLEEAGFIDWDHEDDTITRGPNFEEIQPLISLMQAHQDELPDEWP